MNKNVVIRGIDIFLPETKIDNHIIIRKYRKSNPNVDQLMKLINKRYIYVDKTKEETVITMSVKAAKNLLTTLKMDSDALDGILYCSNFLEYMTPANSLIIHNELGAINARWVFDMNNECTSMLNGLYLANLIMKENSAKNILLTASSSRAGINTDDEFLYPILSDMGMAVILQSIEEEEKRGCIDYACVTQTDKINCYTFPKCGINKLLRSSNITARDKKMAHNFVDSDYIADIWYSMIIDILKKNNLDKQDIKTYIFNQTSYNYIHLVMGMLNEDISKQVYVGYDYGYTGSSCVFLALYKAYQEERIHKGDYIIMCSVGAGFNFNILLYKA